MAKASGTIDLKAVKDAHDDAATTATTYITKIDDNGIRIHPSSTQNNSTVINANGMEIFEGGTATTNSVASFSSSGVRIGKTDASRLVVDYHSMQLVDKEGETYFHVSDLRDSTGYAEIKNIFKGDGTTKQFFLNPSARNTSYTVTVSDSSGGNVTKTTSSFTFTTAPSNGATITATYTSSSSNLKAYTLGKRMPNTTVGMYSVVEGVGEASSLYSHAEGMESVASGMGAHAEGWQTTASLTGAHAEGMSTSASDNGAHAEGHDTHASGYSSHAEGLSTSAFNNGAHAEGYGTTASGLFAHSEGEDTMASGRASHAAGGGTIASKAFQTAIGKWNEEDSTSTTTPDVGAYAVIVGNGTDDDNRSNALTVGWNGDVVSAGLFTSQGHSAPIGAYDTASNTASIATGTSFVDSGISMSITPGRYIVICYAQFAGNTSGVRGVALALNNTIIDHSQQVQQTISNSSWTTRINSTCVVINDSGTSTLKVKVVQNSGSSLSVTTQMYVMRIR